MAEKKYIDAEAAIEALESTDWYHQNKNKDMVHGANSSEDQAWYKEQDVYAAIRSIPAADVRHVIRANWKTVKYPLYECSNCGAVYQDVGYGFNYCPNCGAWMGES